MGFLGKPLLLALGALGEPANQSLGKILEKQQLNPFRRSVQQGSAYLHQDALSVSYYSSKSGLTGNIGYLSKTFPWFD